MRESVCVRGGGEERGEGGGRGGRWGERGQNKCTSINVHVHVYIYMYMYLQSENHLLVTVLLVDVRATSVLRSQT